jgi:hypothetical protein
MGLKKNTNTSSMGGKKSRQVNKPLVSYPPGGSGKGHQLETSTITMTHGKHKNFGENGDDSDGTKRSDDQAPAAGNGSTALVNTLGKDAPPNKKAKKTGGLTVTSPTASNEGCPLPPRTFTR